MKIYTRKGDSGSTQTYNGTSLPKNHLLMQALGELDLLNSSIGVYLSLTPLFIKETIVSKQINFLDETHHIQSSLFEWGALLSQDEALMHKKEALLIIEEATSNLEKAIDFYTHQLPPLKQFILPEGSTSASFCHQSRSLCRQVERSLVSLKLSPNEPFSDLPILPYINRLSDYLFTVARWLNHTQKVTECPWTTLFNKK